jgi:hypothetical protein
MEGGWVEMALEGPRPPMPARSGSATVRRIRHEARDSICAASLSLVGSLLVTGVLWALMGWLA